MLTPVHHSCVPRQPITTVAHQRRLYNSNIGRFCDTGKVYAGAILRASGLLVKSYKLSCGSKVQPGSVECAGSATQLEATGTQERTKGLYGTAELLSPEDFLHEYERAKQHCLKVLQKIVCAEGPELQALVHHYELQVALLQAPATHCSQHHQDAAWRAAAQLVLPELQQCSRALHQLLASYPPWSQLQPQQPTSPVSDPADRQHVKSDVPSSEQTSESQALHDAYPPHGTQQATTVVAGCDASPGAGTAEPQQHSCSASSDHKTAGSGGVAPHTGDVQEKQFQHQHQHQQQRKHQHEHQHQQANHQQQQQQQQSPEETWQEGPAMSAGQLKRLLAMVQHEVDVASHLPDSIHEEVQELEQLQQAACQLLGPLVAGPASRRLLLLHTSQLEGDEALARGVQPLVQGPQGGWWPDEPVLTLAQLCSIMSSSQAPSVDLVRHYLLSRQQQQAGRASALGGDVAGGQQQVVAAGPAVMLEAVAGQRLTLGPLVYCSSGAAQALARGEVGQDGGCPVVALVLDPGVVTALLCHHPSRTLRAAVHQAFVQPMASVLLQLLDVLRAIRDDLADCYNQPSYAHVQLARSSAGGPRAASSFLKDVSAALRPLAEDHLEQCKQLLCRREGDSGSMDVQPWDLDWCRTQLQEGPDLVEWWPQLSSCFTLASCLEGLSGLLGIMGLSLQPSEQGPGEAWGPDTIKVHVYAQNHQQQHHQQQLQRRGPVSGGDLAHSLGAGDLGSSHLGTIYVSLDSECSLPFTALLRPGSTSSRTATAPRVAIHLPSRQFTQPPGTTLFHSVATDPQAIRHILHEMGHALHYLLTSQGPALRHCALFAAADLRELAAHLVERAASDPVCLALMSHHPVTATPLTARQCQPLATHMSQQRSLLALHGHALVALADLYLHTNDHSLQDLPAWQVVQRVGQQHGGAGPSWLTSLQGCAILSGAVVTPSEVYAYASSQLVAAALWNRHMTPWLNSLHAHHVPSMAAPARRTAARDHAQLDGAAHGSAAPPEISHRPKGHAGPWGLRKLLFEAGGSATLAEQLGVLLGPRSVRRVAEGWVPDLAHEAFQGLQL